VNREGKEVKMIGRMIARLRSAYWTVRFALKGKRYVPIAGGAKTILKNVEVLINGVDLSDHCRQVTIDTSADEVDTSAFKGSYKETQPGLTIQVSDLDTPGMDPYRMTSRLFGYQPMSGAVGEASTTEVTFRNAASGGVTRITS
jgi:hypothetical protein